jgi:hypothetical protein
MKPQMSKTDRLPAQQLINLRALLNSRSIQLLDGTAADAKLHELRGMYEPYLNALSDVLAMPLPSWLPEPDAKDNWENTMDGHT